MVPAPLLTTEPFSTEARRVRSLAAAPSAMAKFRAAPLRSTLGAIVADVGDALVVSDPLRTSVAPLLAVTCPAVMVRLPMVSVKLNRSTSPELAMVRFALSAICSDWRI